MQETINLIEQKLGENKEVLRRLSDEQEKLISMLTEGHSKKKQLSNQNMNLERQLKDLYDQQFNRGKQTCDGLAMKSGANKNTNVAYTDLREDVLTPHKDGN